MESALSAASPRHLLRANVLDRILRGQAKIESTLDELKRSVDRLPEALKSTGLRDSIRERPTLVMTTPIDSGAIDVSPCSREQRPPLTTMPMDTGIIDPSWGMGASEAIDIDLKSEGPQESIPIITPTATGTEPSAYHPSERVSYSLDKGADHFHQWRLERIASLSGVDSASAGAASEEGGAPIAYVPHDAFKDMSLVIQRTDYARVKELMHSQVVAKVKSTRSSNIGFAANARTDRRIPALPFHPTSTFRVAFDVAGMLVLVHDSLTVPVILAWDVDVRGWLRVVAWMLALFWTIDMLLNFCTGFSQSGRIVMSFRPIAGRYLRGGFSVDLGVLLVDYSELIISAAFPALSSGSLRVLKFLRFAKITRLVRVLAKIKLGLQTHIDSIFYYRMHKHGLSGYARYLRLAAILAKLLVLIAWLSHIGSCVWYFLGRSWSREYAESWFHELPENSSAIFNYMQGLYWSLSTMFSGASSTPPNTTSEAVLSSVCVILGALFVTSITSTLAAILIEAQEVQQEMKRKDRALTAFMEQNNTPVLLALAVRADFLSQVASAPRLTEGDLTFLPLIAPGLRAALRESMYGRHFYRLPVIRILGALQDGAMADFCFTASSTALQRGGQEVFAAGHEVESAILLFGGSMSYTLWRDPKPTPDAGGLGMDSRRCLERAETRRISALDVAIAGRSSVPKEIKPGTWLCELAMFLQWRTVGSLWATKTCELLVVTSEDFIKVVSLSPEMAAFSSMYAAQLAQCLNQENSIPPSDLETALDCDKLVADMHFSIRELVSVPLLDMVARQQNTLIGKIRRKGVAELEAEVLAGKCHLARDVNGEIYRVVRLVVLRLKNSEGLLCVNIGQIEDGTCTPKFQLPGRKVEASELPEEAARGLLFEELLEFGPHIEFEYVETVVEYEASASFGLPTKYIKLVQTAVLRAQLDFGVAQMMPEPSMPFRGVLTPMSMPSTAPSSQPSRMRSNRSMESRISANPFMHSERTQRAGASPLSIEGSEHAFAHLAVHHKNKQVLRLYKWVDAQVFEYLSMQQRRQDTEAAILPWINQANKEKLEQLTRWTVRTSLPLQSPSTNGDHVDHERPQTCETTGANIIWQEVL